MILSLCIIVTAFLTVVQAQVTILYDSDSLTYSSGWDTANEFGGCPPGYRANSKPATSVQLTFTGTSIQATLIKDEAAADALIYVDGKLVDTLSSYDANQVAFNGCQTVSGGTDQLPDGQHNVTLVNNRSSNTTTNLVAIYFVSFTYHDGVVNSSTTAAAAAATGINVPSSSLDPQTTAITSYPPSSGSFASSSPIATLPTQTNGSATHSSLVGAVIGGIIGGLAVLLLGIGLILWCLRRTRPSSNVIPSQDLPEPQHLTRSAGRSQLSVDPFMSQPLHPYPSSANSKFPFPQSSRTLLPTGSASDGSSVEGEPPSTVFLYTRSLTRQSQAPPNYEA